MLRTSMKLLVLFGGVMLSPLHGQQPASGSSAGAANEFHVDGSCRIHEMVTGPQGPKDHTYKDRGICSVDPFHSSVRTETDISATQRKRKLVKILEHTFTLHN